MPTKDNELQVKLYLSVSLKKWFGISLFSLNIQLLPCHTLFSEMAGLIMHVARYLMNVIRT